MMTIRTVHRRLARLLWLTGLVGLTCGSVAGHAASRDEQERACRGDALHYCSADIPDKQKITACMKQHYDQLTPACKAMFHQPATDDAPKN